MSLSQIYPRRAAAATSRRPSVAAPASILMLLCAAGAAFAPAQAHAQASGFYSAKTSVTREGVDGGPPEGQDNSGSLPTASSIRGDSWQTVATADDTYGGTVTASVTQAVEFSQPTFISALSALSQLRYTFTLEGPDADATIPVLFTAAGSASVSPGSGEADISLYFSHDGATLGRRSQIGFGPPPWTAAFDVEEIVYLHTGQIYSLVMTAEAQTNVHHGNSGDGLAFATASVDPTFAIQGEYSSSYHFVGLPDSGVVAAVPEPSTWAMMLAGLLVVTGVAERRGLRSIA